MKYFIKTNYHQYTKTSLFKKDKDVVELISIAIIDEDGREFYGVSKDFELKKAWVNEHTRENIILPIVYEMAQKEDKDCFQTYGNYNNWEGDILRNKNVAKFWFKKAKALLNEYGYSNEELARAIQKFCFYKDDDHLTGCFMAFDSPLEPEFYGSGSVFNDNDQKVFHNLFGESFAPCFRKNFLHLESLWFDTINNSINRGMNDKSIYFSNHTNKRYPYSSIKEKFNIKEPNCNYILTHVCWSLNLFKYLENNLQIK